MLTSLTFFCCLLFLLFCSVNTQLWRASCWDLLAEVPIPTTSPAPVFCLFLVRASLLFLCHLNCNWKKLSLTKLERHLYTFCKTVFYYVFVKLLNCKVDCFKEKLVILTVYSFFSEIYSTSYLLVENINWSQTFEF